MGRGQETRPINAKAETLESKPFFRDSFRKWRCLIPANGFYEWKKEKSGKQPYFIRLKDAELFAFAGLWDNWQDQDTAAIITTDATEILKPIYARMPVILRPDNYGEWLEEGDHDLLQPGQEELETYSVSAKVNSPKNDSADLINAL